MGFWPALILTMRIFILPSWCPTDEDPISGSFFVEQANAIAELRPEWTIALCQFNLDSSRINWRLNHVFDFIYSWFRESRMSYYQAPTGLNVYKVWDSYLPSLGSEGKWVGNIRGLSLQCKHALEDFIKRFGKPDLIHAHAVYPGGGAAVILGREYGIPVVLSEHLNPFPPITLMRSDGEIMPFIVDTYKKVVQCSAVSESLSKRIINLGLKDEVQVLSNFLPNNFVNQRPKIPKLRTDFLFLSVGGPSFIKGTDVLLTAFANLKSKARLNIIGNSSELIYFQNMANDLGLAESVKFLGSVARDDISDYFQECDVFILPSTHETFGVVYIEALACGKPLIATRCGGPEDIINQRNGKLVAVGDIKALSNAMQYMIENASTYQADSLVDEYTNRFAASAVIDKLECWYKAAINYSN